MRVLSILILLLVAILGISFALLNAKPVTLNYYLGIREIPLSILLVATFIFGIVLGMLLLLPKIMKLNFEIHRLKKMLKS